MPRFSLASLRSRAIILVLLAVAPVLALTLYAHLEQRALTIKEVQRDAFVAARNMANMQGTLFRNGQQLLTLLAQLPQVRQRDPKACTDLFANLMKEQQGFAALLAAKPDGEVFASFPPLTSPLNIADRRWFRRVIVNPRFIIGETQFGRLSGKFSIPLAYPVLDVSGQLTAILSIGMNLEWLGSLLARSDLLGAAVATGNLPTDSALILADNLGRLLFRYPNPQDYEDLILLEHPSVQAMTGEDEGVADALGLDGKPRLFGYTRMPPPFRDLIVAVSIPKEEVLRQVNRDLWRSLIWLAAVSALAAAAAWFGAKVFVLQPVDKLLKVTRRLTGGDLTARTGAPYGDGELGQLGRAFDHMADSLQERDTDLKKTAAELQQRVRDLDRRSQELAAANKELGDFAYSVAHDLRSPLRSIGGFARVLLEDYPDRLDENGKRYLNIIHQDARKMGQLIDDLLTLTRLGRKEMHPVHLNMTELAKGVFDDLKGLYPERDLQIEIQPLPVAWGDRAMIRQVLSNLLLNALKFTQDRQPASILVGGRSEADDQVYCVKDNGAGFDMRYVNKLFNVFQRLHPEREFDGTGVGLAIVKRIIDRHGGRVWAEGKINEGAAFYFSLPEGEGT